MNNHKFALVWNNGKVCIGEDWIIAKHFLKSKNLMLGIIRVNGQLFYSTKSTGLAHGRLKVLSSTLATEC